MSAEEWTVVNNKTRSKKASSSTQVTEEIPSTSGANVKYKGNPRGEQSRRVHLPVGSNFKSKGPSHNQNTPKYQHQLHSGPRQNPNASCKKESKHTPESGLPVQSELGSQHGKPKKNLPSGSLRCEENVRQKNKSERDGKGLAKEQAMTFSLSTAPEKVKEIPQPAKNKQQLDCDAKEPTKAAPVEASDESITKKKPRKNVSKAQRQRKREEKFYQALYKNKDSHIQFVTADVIRKLQGNQQSRSHAGRKEAVSITESIQSRNEWPSFQTTQDGLHSTEGLDLEFPSLNSAPITKGNQHQINEQLEVCTAQDFADEHFPEVKTAADVLKESKKVKKINETVKASEVATPSSKGKKSKQPMIIDVSSLIVSNKKERELDRKKELPVSKGGLRKENFKITLGNQLDSSGPGIIHRGKIRQKKKKPSKLKLAILKTRTLRRLILQQHETEEDAEKGSPTAKEAVQDAEELIETKTVDTSNNFFGESLRDHIAEKIVGDLNILSLDDKVTLRSDSAINTQIANLAKVIKSECVEKQDNVAPKVKDEFKTNRSSSNKSEPSSIENHTKGDADMKFIQLLDEFNIMNVEKKPIPSEVESEVKGLIHNRKFRDYCDMYTSKELHGHVICLLSDLHRFQDRLYHSDPIKFKTKRRLITGLKDAFSYLNLNKVQLLILAPDIERNPEPGGLDDRVSQIISVARSGNVPYIFSGNKYVLGKPLRIKTPVSVVAILDKQNCEETFQKLMEEAAQLRRKYQNEFSLKVEELMNLRS